MFPTSPPPVFDIEKHHYIPMTKPIPFSVISKALAPLDREALVKLIGELYALNERNRDFLDTRFVPKGASLKQRKKTIRKAIFSRPPASSRRPDNYKDMSFLEVRRVIGDYCKAAGDAEGLAELWVFAAECGTRFTLEHGDMDEPFYDALENSFAAAAKAVAALDEQTAASFVDRLHKLISQTDGTIGWGLHEGFEDAFYDVFGEEGRAFVTFRCPRFSP
jgi:hypothetical protein